IKDILIISTPNDIDLFKGVFGDGSHLGISIIYKIQQNPRGIAEAFIIAEEFIGSSKVALVLGDNIFYGAGLSGVLQKAVESKVATIFGYHVNNPQDFGVVEFDKNYNVLSVIEKPESPKSNYAIPGLY
ncbi:glucose-1-phosphate thymidylyltransferase, partial [Clostridium perfringens]